MTQENNFHTLLETWKTSGAVPEKNICKVEAALNVKFPPQYRKFLLKYGAANTNGFEIAGIFTHCDKNSPPMWLDVEYFTRISTFADVYPNKEQIAIATNGGDYTFYLDTRLESYGAVLELGPDVNKIVANSFHDFIIKIFNNEILI